MIDNLTTEQLASFELYKAAALELAYHTNNGSREHIKKLVGRIYQMMNKPIVNKVIICKSPAQAYRLTRFLERYDEGEKFLNDYLEEFNDFYVEVACAKYDEHVTTNNSISEVTLEDHLSESDLDEDVSNFVNSNILRHLNAAEALYYEFYNKELNVEYEPKPMEFLKLYKEMMLNFKAMWVFDECAIVSMNPIKIDKENNVVLYADGLMGKYLADED